MLSRDHRIRCSLSMLRWLIQACIIHSLNTARMDGVPWANRDRPMWLPRSIRS